MNVALHPRSLDLISLCTGGGGLDLGVELALPGTRSVVMVEREAFAVAHLVAAIEQGLLAPAAIWDDVRTFDGRPWRDLVDGVIGGIPCQPHSLAGRKQGSLDARDLWSDARRHIVAARPWFVLIENVAGMLAAGADEIAGAERVWRDLRKLGFEVEIGLFTAAEVGASHQRERLFIVGVADTIRRVPHRRRPKTVRAACGAPEGEARFRQRRRNDAGDRGVGLAERSVAHPKCDGWGQGDSGATVCGRKPEPYRDGSTLSPTLVDTSGGRHAGQSESEIRSEVERAFDPRAGGELGLYPPGPADLDGWRRVLAHSPDLEPAVRRMADGVAARLDLAGPHAARVERLRLLGNGVVSLEAAHAVRTLIARLAARGAPGAAELVRRMIRDDR